MDLSNKVKILVLGDSGVGKTALVHALCYNEIITDPPWTLGCNIEVKMLQELAGKTNEASIEFWEVGGSLSYEKSRSVFYKNTNGLILVYDTSNSRSQTNLNDWMSEVYEELGLVSFNQDFNAYQIPTLVVGTRWKKRRIKTNHNISDMSMLNASSISSNYVQQHVYDSPKFSSFSKNRHQLEIRVDLTKIESLDDYNFEINDFLHDVIQNSRNGQNSFSSSNDSFMQTFDKGIKLF